jgi:hypothetical protein
MANNFLVISHSGPHLKKGNNFRPGYSLASRVINLAEVVGRCNVFFVTHAVVLHSKESSDPIIIGDFGGGSGMGML